MSPEDLVNHDLMKFFHNGRKQVFKRNEIIMRAGDTPQGIYYLEEGHVKVYSLSKQGDEHTHLFYMPGDIFPMMYAFQDAIRNVYYEAQENTVVWLVARDKFREFANSNAKAAIGLLEQSLDMFRIYAGRIDNLLYSNSHERTAYRLLSIVERMGRIQSDGTWIVKAPITHQDIASSVNLSRETVSRAMERLRRKGIIGPNIHHQLIVNDLSALAHIVGEDEVVGMWPHLAKFIYPKTKS